MKKSKIPEVYYYILENKRRYKLRIQKNIKILYKNHLKNCEVIDNLTEKIETWNSLKERSLNITTVFVREF